jgi:hypothetical protein
MNKWRLRPVVAALRIVNDRKDDLDDLLDGLQAMLDLIYW